MQPMPSSTRAQLQKARLIIPGCKLLEDEFDLVTPIHTKNTGCIEVEGDYQKEETLIDVKTLFETSYEPSASFERSKKFGRPKLQAQNRRDKKNY